MNSRHLVSAIVSMTGMLISGVTQAQDEPGALQEVVVTATRREDVASRIPMTLSAVTQQGLDEQGIKTTADLAGSRPCRFAASSERRVRRLRVSTWMT
jgi:iron complex outermembrane recepter protein